MGGDQSPFAFPFEGDSFNPRPRMGGDNSKRPDAIAELVSIHAPAWGATYRLFETAGRSKVSIHAPAWGATGFKSNTSLYKTCFNPRPRMGGDPCKPTNR